MSNDERAQFERAMLPYLSDNPTWRESASCELAWVSWQARAAIAQQPDTERMRDALESIKRHCEPQPGALARAIVATCDGALQGAAIAQQPTPDCGHGHVYPRADGVKARCGGPQVCSKCRLDLEAKQGAAIAQPAEPAKTRKTRWHVGEKALTPYGIGTVSRISSGVGFTEYFFADLELPAGRFAVNERDMQEAPTAQADAQPVAWRFARSYWDRLESVPADLRAHAQPLYAAAPPARQPLSEAQILEWVRAVGLPPPMGLTRDRGPYEVTEPTYYLQTLVRAIERAYGTGEGE